MWWLVLIYIAVTALVIFCAVSLSSILDQLDKRTKISSVFLGGLVLAVVTSLPDLFTAIASVCFIKQPSLAFGGILGSNIINLAILSFFVVLSTKQFVQGDVSKKFFNTTIASLVVAILLLINAFVPTAFVIPAINLNAISLIIVAIYTVMLLLNRGDEKTHTVDTLTVSKFSIKQLTWFFILCSIALILCSIALSFITNVLSDYYMIDKNLAGALFLGLSTSLPEIVTSAVFIKKKNFNLAVGSIVGSVAFNWIILVLADILYIDGTIYMKDLSAQVLTGFLAGALLIMSITLSIKCFAKKQEKLRWLYFLFGVITIAITLAYLITSFYIL